MKSICRIFAFALIVLLSLCAFGEGLIEVTLRDDCFVKPDERELIISVSDNVTRVEVRTAAGKKLIPDENSGVCVISVTQEELDAGILAFDVICYIDGETHESHHTLPVRMADDICEGKLHIVFPDRPLAEGETVPLRYEITNSGRIRFAKAILKTETGEEVEIADIPTQTTVGFTRYVTVRNDTEYTLSAQVISPYTGKITDLADVSASPEFAREQVIVTAVCEKQVRRGQSARMTLNIENRGNVSYHGCALYCDGRFAACELPDVLEPGDFTTLNLTTPIVERDSSFSYTLTLIRADGSEKTEPPVLITVLTEGEEEINETNPDNDPPGASGNLLRNTVLFLVGLDAISRTVLIGCGAVSIVLAAAILISKKRKTKEDDD